MARVLIVDDAAFMGYQLKIPYPKTGMKSPGSGKRSGRN
jgi:hypothetical protein